MGPAARLILIEPDAALAGALAELLAGHFEVETANDWAQAEALAPAGVILAPAAAGISGIRKNHSGPVILLGDGAGGADAAIVMPFRFRDLLARIQASLAGAAVPRQIGRWRFDPVQRQIVNEAAARHMLTEKEAEILDFLLAAGGQPVSREELLQEVWGYQAGVSTHTLETHIYRLRQKIEEDPSEARVLVTVPGGYQLFP